MTEIELSGNRYPICMDLNVLAEIQDKYGNTLEFEKKLRGLVPSADGKGWIVKNEPSAKVIAYVLPIMINEAIEIKADMDQDYPVKRVSRIKIINDVDKSPQELADIISEELAICFNLKKKRTESSGKNQKTKKARWLTWISSVLSAGRSSGTRKGK